VALVSKRSIRGLTLVEIIAVLGIVVILAMLLIGVVAKLPGAGDQARCMANLKSLYVSLSNYTEENGHWPQQPAFPAARQVQYEDWWLKTLKPYDATESTWLCPAVTRLGKLREGNFPHPRVCYSPTMFDDQPRTPWKWPGMPWLVEIANVHGHGALMIFPDGSIRNLDDVLAERGH